MIIEEAMLFRRRRRSDVQTVCGPVCDGVVPPRINSLAEGAADADVLGAARNGEP